MTFGDPLGDPPEEEECSTCCGLGRVQVTGSTGSRPFYINESTAVLTRWPHGDLYVPCPTCRPPPVEKE